jgi:uncharacterized membrane protein
MRAHRKALLGLAAIATLALASAEAAFAQDKQYNRGGSPNIGANRPTMPSRGNGGYRGGGYRGGAGPGIVMATPQMAPPGSPGGGQFIDDGAGLADAYGSLMAQAAPMAAATARPVSPVSTGAR